jgi:hypothetical protein
LINQSKSESKVEKMGIKLDKQVLLPMRVNRRGRARLEDRMTTDNEQLYECPNCGSVEGFLTMDYFGYDDLSGAAVWDPRLQCLTCEGLTTLEEINR